MKKKSILILILLSLLACTPRQNAIKESKPLSNTNQSQTQPSKSTTKYKAYGLFSFNLNRFNEFKNICTKYGIEISILDIGDDFGKEVKFYTIIFIADSQSYINDCFDELKEKDWILSIFKVSNIQE